MKKSVFTLVILSGLMLLSACETMNGLGRDTSKLGNDISGSAARNQ